MKEAFFDNERLDLPSASSAYRRRRCVGSQNLINELRTQGLLAKIPPSQDAQSGTLVHRAWAGERTLSLSRVQIQTLAQLDRLQKMLLADWSGADPVFLLGREERLWLRQGIEPLHSGQYDAAYFSANGTRALILDAKTLYGEIEPADHNDQLRELVALFRFNYPSLEQFRVAILSPNLAERCTLADYDQYEAELALRLLRLSLSDSSLPGAPRTPGPYCTTCPARLNCAETRSLIGTTYSLAKRIQEGEFTLPLGEKGARFIENIKTARALLKTYEGAYKEAIQSDPNCVPGWHLKNGNKVREIFDPLKAWELASQLGLSTQEFLACAEMPVGKLQDGVGTALSLSGRELTRCFNDTFEPVIALRQNAPSLAPTNPKKTQSLPR
jgi:hypothetical protein